MKLRGAALGTEFGSFRYFGIQVLSLSGRNFWSRVFHLPFLVVRVAAISLMAPNTGKT